LGIERLVAVALAITEEGIVLLVLSRRAADDDDHFAGGVEPLVVVISAPLGGDPVAGEDELALERRRPARRHRRIVLARLQLLAGDVEVRLVAIDLVRLA